MNDYYSFYNTLDEYCMGRKIERFKNDFRSKKEIIKNFEDLFSNLGNYKYAMLSYNSNSYPDKDALVNLILKYNSKVEVIEKKHNYQVTGKGSKHSNKELLFLITVR